MGDKEKTIMSKIKDGYIDFMDFKTYYRIANPMGKKTPLLLLHGGPGSTHTYFKVFDDLAEKDDRPIVMYDQIGCGKSMITGHPELFTAEVWLNELENLREKLELNEVHILGQSWGGMLNIFYAIEKKPKGVKSYILSSTLHSAKLWAEEQHRYIKLMPLDMQEAIAKAEKNDDYTDPEYKKAEKEFMQRHCMPEITDEMPDCVKEKKVAGKEAYFVAWGPNEFTPKGNLKDYDFTERLCEIDKPCLIMSGQMDMSTPYIAKDMHDRIKGSKWELFQHSRHVPYIEEKEKYQNILKTWLNDND